MELEATTAPTADVDPYSTTMVAIANALVAAHDQSGSMSEGEFKILGEIARISLEEDDAAFPPNFSW